jgi:hypothetical protein
MPRHAQALKGDDEVEPLEKGEIAYRVLKHLMCEKGITVSRNHMREIPNIAMKIGVDASDLAAFAQGLATDVLNECFSFNNKQ